MTIKEIGSVSDELPPARLYFDDLEEIESIFRACGAIPDAYGHTHTRATYVIGRFECTELEELKQFGERTSKLEITIYDGEGALGYVFIGPRTVWEVSPKHRPNGFQIYGRLNALFETRKIRWKAALRTIPHWLLLLVVLFFVVPEMFFMVQSGAQPHFKSDRMFLLIFTSMWAIITFWSVYRYIFAPTIVEFRRVHDPQGFRKRWAEWKPYVFAAVIGGGITKLLDIVTTWIRSK